MIVAGIDPSLTNTGIVIGDGGTTHVAHSIGSRNRGNSCAFRMARYDEYVTKIMDAIDAAGPVELIAIEQYVFASPRGQDGKEVGQKNAKFVAEFGGILRWHLVDVAPVFEVMPTYVKMFATGHGRADKTAVAGAIVKRYGVTLKNDDEYDAYTMYRMACVAAGIHQSETTKQAEAIAKVFNGYKHVPAFDAKLTVDESECPF